MVGYYTANREAAKAAANKRYNRLSDEINARRVYLAQCKRKSKVPGSIGEMEADA